MKASGWHREQRRQGLGGERVPGDRALVLDPEDQDATLGVRERGDVLGDLVTNRPAVSDTLSALRPFVERLAVEVLTLVLPEERGDVETLGPHGQTIWRRLVGTTTGTDTPSGA